MVVFRRLLVIYLSFVVLTGVLFIVVNPPTKPSDWAGWLGLMTIYTLFMAILYRLSTWRWSRQYDQNPEYHAEVVIELIDGELSMRTAQSMTRIPRSWIHRVRLGSTVVLLFRSSDQFHVIPKTIYRDLDGLAAWIDGVPGRSS